MVTGYLNHTIQEYFGEGSKFDENKIYTPQIEDATKVLVNSKVCITKIGKNISSWNAVDTGVFLLDKSIFEVIERAEKITLPVTISDCIQKLIRNGEPLWACDVSGLFWLDMDTFDDVFLLNRSCGWLECRENGTA